MNTIILDNLRSGYNTGSIYRTAHSFGFEKIIHIGTTPNTNNPSFLSASRGMEKFIKTEKFDIINEVIEKLKRDKYIIYVLEINEESEKLTNINIEEPFAIILGNEALGVSKYALENSDKIIEIQTIGKRSLNVSIAFGIFAYNFLKNKIL